MGQTVTSVAEEFLIPLAVGRRVALVAVVVLAAVSRFWHLGEAGFGTEYYAAAVRSMLLDPHNALFGAFDPAGILAVDKPPLALWLQTLSAAVLGFTPFALMLPQAIEGCLAVLLTWHLVRRDFGEIAGLVAALFLALTPVAVAVDRSNNTDSLLVLVLLLAVWALPRRGDPSPVWRLTLAMALVGVGFNVKMMAAFGVLPGFAAAGMLTARGSWMARLSHLAIAGMALLAVSLSWIGMVAMTPAPERPYVDSTRDNSIFDLVVNHNALQRFMPRVGISGQPRGAANAVSSPGTNGADPTIGNRLGMAGTPPGPGRLIDPRMAHQAIWLLPLAVAGAAGMISGGATASAAVWIGWAVAYWVAFSFAGGLFSAYYLVLLGPPLAALAAVGSVTIATAWRGWHVPAALVAGFVWQGWLLWPGGANGGGWDSAEAALLAAVLGGLVVCCVVWLLMRPRTRGMAAVTAGVAGLLIAPAGWSMGTIAYEGGRPLARLQPTRDRVGRAAASQSRDILALMPFLRQNRGDALFLAATSNARLAAPMIIATGEPVAAFGGFLGTIPVLNATALARMVDNGTLRFAVVGDGYARRQAGAPESSGATRWIVAHGTRVDLAAITPELAGARFALYDLRHDPAAPEPRGY